MPPVLALVIQSFIQHLHDLNKIASEEFVDISSKRYGIDVRSLTHWLYVNCAISFITVPEGPQASLEVASRTFARVSEYPFV